MRTTEPRRTEPTRTTEQTGTTQQTESAEPTAAAGEARTPRHAPSSPAVLPPVALSSLRVPRSGIKHRAAALMCAAASRRGSK